MKPLIKDTPKEDKPPNKGQAESTLVYTLYRKSLLKEDNLSTKDKTVGPKGVLIKRFHCTSTFSLTSPGLINCRLVTVLCDCHLNVCMISKSQQ